MPSLLACMWTPLIWSLSTEHLTVVPCLCLFTDPTDRVLGVSGTAPIGGPDLEFLLSAAAPILTVGLPANSTIYKAVVIGRFSGPVAEPGHSFLCIRQRPVEFP